MASTPQRKRASKKKTKTTKKTSAKAPAKASRRQVVNVPKEFTFAETARIHREFKDAMQVCRVDSSKADIKKAAKVLDDVSPLARALCVRVSNPKRVNDHFDAIDEAISQCEKLNRYERHDLFRETGYQWAQWLALSQDIVSFKYHHGDGEYSARCYLEQYAAHAEHSANVVIERFGNYDWMQDAEEVEYPDDRPRSKFFTRPTLTGWAVAPELGALAEAIRPRVNPDRPLQRATQSLPRDATYVETLARLERVDKAVEAVVEFVRHYEGGEYIFSDIQQELSNAIQAARLVVPKTSKKPAAEIYLNRTEQDVLEVLSNTHGKLLSTCEIAVGAKKSESPVKDAVNVLIGNGLACRPEGPRSGAAITSEGRQFIKAQKQPLSTP